MRSFRHRTALAAAFATLTFQPSPSSGQDGLENDTIPVFDLEPITVTGRLDDLVGRASSASAGYVGFRDLARRPLTRVGELLETVPGMILTQHSGSGKSNQMFVRGFNLDHGTDFATRVEGMPVNIPSHAHGQGYTDLNFLIPELVDNVEYALGNYYADIGDFGSAGGAHIRLRDDLEQPLFIAGAGENGHRRMVTGGSFPVGSAGTLLAGGELQRYDGPWEIPEEVRKLSGFLRFTHTGQGGRLSLLAMAYDNDWQASDQIPLRAVQRGVISRFGQIDESLGGASSRHSLSLTWNRTGARSSQRIEGYGIRYSLDLFSNFTYGLEDPARGDQFRQEDDGRTTWGLLAAHQQLVELSGREHRWTVGTELRVDQADLTLSRTRDRAAIGVVRTDLVDQLGAGFHAELESPWTDRFKTTLGIRADLHRFDVVSDRAENTGVADGAIVSPKASLAYTAGEQTELYLAGGMGFHSNDARGTVTTIDPVTNEPTTPVDPLVRSRGAELGVRTNLLEGLRSTASLWTVDLDSELLFVGDAGGTEASGASRRIGLTLANFWRIDPEWSADIDLSLTRARFTDAEERNARIPGALESVLALGLSHEPGSNGVFGTLRVRRFGSYPLVEDGSVRSSAASLMNLRMGYRLGAARVTLAVFNVLDEEHSDIQYFYASRLHGEPTEGVEDLHFHPAVPRAFRMQVSWGF